MHREREPASISAEHPLQSLASRRIFFGHQSIGADIVRGLEEIRRESPGIPFRLIETRDPDALSSPGFCHCRIGRNTDPESKICDFDALLNEGFGERLDIALFKFCYVDIHRKSDIERIFRIYAEAMSRLKKTFRLVTFVHVTVPVVRDPGMAGGFLRRVLGGSQGRSADNAARGRFNETVARRYAGSEPVFDLASIESGLLASEFADDGSHLNTKGCSVVAEALMTFLSAVAAGTVVPA